MIEEDEVARPAAPANAARLMSPASRLYAGVAPVPREAHAWLISRWRFHEQGIHRPTEIQASSSTWVRLK